MASEQDIEIMEMYLDHALDPADADRLRQRFAAEPTLAGELLVLEQQRLVRQLAWQSMEATDDVGQRLAAGIAKQAQHHAWYQSFLANNLQRIAVSAACLGMFFVGWEYGHTGITNRIALPGGGQSARPVSLITSQQVADPATNTPVFEVSISDASGKVVRTERFNNLNDARQFIEQTRRQLLQQTEP